ncbi:MAG: tetratricopeptide repeat protein [Bacteroidales bacterium]|nr:tetratricopeptide repeat protein [Bacteroidales bacterium]
MNDNFDSFLEEEGIFESINRFEEMVNRNRSCYFDVHEFESIIDYYLDQHNFHCAKDAIERALKQHPSSSAIKLRLAQAYVQNGKPSKGLHFLREIEALEGNNSDFFLLKGTALNVLGKREEAHTAFDRAIQLTLDGKDDMILSIAYSYINTRHYKLAIRYLKLAFEVNPKNLGVIHELALIYEKVDQLTESINYYKKYLDLDPYAEHIWFNMGMVYSSLEKFDDAIDAYEFAIAISPDYISAYFSKGNTLVNSEQYHEAIATFEQILALEPDNTQAFTYIGECYDKLNLFKRSTYYYRRALAIDETYSDAWYGLGMAYFSMDEYAHCIELFQQANSHDPENPDYWYMLGEAYRKLNILDKSAESYSRAVELDPNDYEAWLSHADIFFMEKRINEAISLLNKAYEYNKEISTINYNLAAYYLYDNNLKLAGKYFEKGLRINYSEHNEMLLRFPITTSSELFSRLIKKYKNLSQ